MTKENLANDSRAKGVRGRPTNALEDSCCQETVERFRFRCPNGACCKNQEAE